MTVKDFIARFFAKLPQLQKNALTRVRIRKVWKTRTKQVKLSVILPAPFSPGNQERIRKLFKNTLAEFPETIKGLVSPEDEPMVIVGFKETITKKGQHAWRASLTFRVRNNTRIEFDLPESRRTLSDIIYETPANPSY